MTSRARFKDLVRARMETTGESYSIAKRNIETQCLRDQAFTLRLLAAGKALSEADVASLERGLEERPHNVSARLELIGHYAFNHGSASAQAHARRHLVWVTKEHPDACVLRLIFGRFDGEVAADAYAEVRRVLFERLEKHEADVSLLVNAGLHVHLREKDLAAALFTRAHALAPADVQVALTIAGHLLVMKQPRLALDALERSLAVVRKDEARFVLLGTAAKAALLSKELAASKRYADELLSLAPKIPSHLGASALHRAHSIRGLVALEAGDLTEANAELVESGKTPWSPQLDPFGPSMRLAAELAKRGQTRAVLDYFELCGRFWKSGHDKLASWAAVVASGDEPDFGPNLYY